MANIRKVERKGNGTRSRYAWEVRYRDPHRRDRSKTFRTKHEAEGFANVVEADISRGHYLDPRLGKKSLRDWATEWLEAREGEIKPKTLIGYQGLLDVHILPAFGNIAMSRIRPLDVQRFLSEMSVRGLSRSRIRQARQLLSAILDSAASNGYIARNPVPRHRPMGREPKRDQHPLTFEQVHAVANAVPDRYLALIYVLAYGGLRWGEAASLRRSCCNLLRNRLEVQETVAEVGGGLYYGPPKTHQNRTVVLPEPVGDILAEHLNRYVDQRADSLVFTTVRGDHIWISNFRKGVWWPALDAADISRVVTIKDMRHTCASLMHAAGRSAKEVKEQLGHSTVAMTLDTYTHLFDQSRDEAAAAMAGHFVRSLAKS